MVSTHDFLIDQLSPIALRMKLGEMFPHEPTFLFESAVFNQDGHASFIMVGDRERVWHKNNESFYKNEEGKVDKIDDNPLTFLKKYYSTIDKESYKKVVAQSGVGFVDGFVGFVGYDMVKEFEPVLKKTMSDLVDIYPEVPDFDFVRPKLIAAYLHRSNRLVLLSGMDEMIRQFSTIEHHLLSDHTFVPLKKATASNEGHFAFNKEEFFKRVQGAKEMIKSGDVFQILISNRYIQEANVDPLSFYRILRTKNPSPYMYLLDFERFSIAGSSPEVMVRLTNGEILLRPIAGTRKRGRDFVRDKELEDEMTSDPKECAEHIMLVDLGRNDVGRVAKSGTVKVANLMRVEKYSHVMHMVSDVVATLGDDYDMFDLFMATFTAGTMTGAPKIRAMELIAQFEGFKRGFYSGSIGYFGFDGNMDSAITIRTALITPSMIVCHAGAGVVADSQDELEYLEVTNKLGSTVSSLNDLLNLPS